MQVHDTAALAEFLDRHRSLFVLTGAGISVGSGIPEYRDGNGDWKRPAPIQYRDYVGREATRRRYWARSLVGWPWFRQARPNACHRWLSDRERQGRIGCLVTQNVDRLHQAAGSDRVTDLHGRLDRVVCLDCGTRLSRQDVQRELLLRNPGFVPGDAEVAPDGDASVEQGLDGFVLYDCPACGGVLKPDVVFFGETVPRPRVEAALASLRAADALLVIGSSLMVYSGYRFCLRAADWGLPIAVVNPGRTRADAIVDLKVGARFEEVIDALSPSRARPADPRGSSA